VGLANQPRADLTGANANRAFEIPYGAMGETTASPNATIYVYGLNVDATGSPIGSGNTALTGTPRVRTNKPLATTTGVYLSDANLTPYCLSKSAKIDLFLLVGSTWEFHNRCYTNTRLDPIDSSGNPVTNATYNFQAYCPFKYPVASGTAASSVVVRTWKMNSSCTLYMDDVDPTSSSSYVDRHPAAAVVADPSFPALDRAVTLERSTYKIRIDRNGGASYEFYPKRGTDLQLTSGKYESALHAHNGAGMGLAIHSGALGSLDSNSCSGQGYWNPTQSGATCTSSSSSLASPAPGDGVSDLTLKCDGTANATCTSATTTVEHTAHRMMNWDYGSTYTGPYNSADQSYLTQTATAFDHYVQFDITLENRGTIPRPSILEIPTFYFTNRFRQVHYPYPNKDSSTVNTFTIPLSPSGNDAERHNADRESVINPAEPISQDIGWVTFEDTLIGVSGRYVTIAWFYKNGTPGICDETSCQGSPWITYVEEGTYYDNLKFTNAPVFTYAANSTYQFRYVIFPYKYNETIPGTGNTVRQTIDAMRAAFQ
jgi:hypothetical protein